MSGTSEQTFLRPWASQTCVSARLCRKANSPVKPNTTALVRPIRVPRRHTEIGSLGIRRLVHGSHGFPRRRVASAIDYAKFLNAIDGQRGTAFLKPSSIAAMTARPAIPDWAGKNNRYGFGLGITSEITSVDWSHNGALDGTSTYQGRTYNGFVWTVFLDWFGQSSAKKDALESGIAPGLWNAASQTTEWPTDDYFTNYPDASPAQAAAKEQLDLRQCRWRQQSIRISNQGASTTGSQKNKLR
jgi:hypothetical protein